MVWAAVAVGRVAVAGHHDRNVHRLGAGHRAVEIVNLKPEQDSVSVRLGIRIADGAMMVPDIPSVELEDQLTTDNEALILPPTVRTLTAEQSLIPAADGLNVLHANERLWIHKPAACP